MLSGRFVNSMFVGDVLTPYYRELSLNSWCRLSNFYVSNSLIVFDA